MKLSTPLTLEELTTAYNVFNNKGKKVSPRFVNAITDENGAVLEVLHPVSQMALEEEMSEQMLGMMLRQVNKGTGRRLHWKYKLEGEMAGQIGTTNSHSDAWFFGLVPDLTVGIWVGGKESEVRFRSLKLGYGGNMALPIYGELMQKIYADSIMDIQPKAAFEMSDWSREQLDCTVK